jgi:CheY-like chemotaxis protein
VDAGATFIVELPLAEPPEARAIAALRPEQTPPAPVLSILIVDDEPAIRGALANYFRREGHVVEAVGTAAEALARVKSERYDRLLVDLRMPDTPGDALYREIERRDPETAARVVFMSGDLESEAGGAFIRATGRPCISKPFEFDDLSTVVLGRPPREG